MSKNLDSVQNIYAAFGKGDVPAILEHLAADVVWEYGSDAHGVPWLAPRRGKPGAAQFFETVGTQLNITLFNVNALLEHDATVVALVSLDPTVKRTGKRFSEVDEAHIWHFGPSGRVVRFRHAADTYQQWLACRP